MRPSQNLKVELATSDDLLICRTCGTQYDTKDRSELNSCRICDDPRQYVPPSGQSFTTLKELKEDPAGYKLVFKQDEDDEHIFSFQVEPKVGIGQRGFIIRTPDGIIIWDIVCFLDDKAVEFIRSLGDVQSIIISHPHFYTTWVDWSRTFGCPVFLSSADQKWLNRSPHGTNADLRLLSRPVNNMFPGVVAMIAGGHFPGSMMLYTTTPATKMPTLFHADTIHIVPSAKSPAHDTDTIERGTTSYTFMWSIPNMIPLRPEDIAKIWDVIKETKMDMVASHGLMESIKYNGGRKLVERVLDSMKVVVKAMGYTDHALLKQEVDW